MGDAEYDEEVQSASAGLFCSAFAIGSSVVLAIQTRTDKKPGIQASLTLNLAQADSNFCLQITFQWLHKSAASSSVFSSPPLLLYLLSFLFFFTPASLHFSSYTPPHTHTHFHHHLPLRLYFTVSLSLSPSPTLSLIFSFPHTPSFWRWLSK